MGENQGSKWIRSDRLNLTMVILAAATLVGMLVIPEVRKSMGLRDSPSGDDNVLTIAFKSGMAYASNHQYENAIKEFKKVELARPDYLGLQMNMGVAYLQLKQYGRARDYLQRAQHQTPNDPNVLYNLACLAAVTGNRAEAIGHLRAAVAYGFRNVALLRSDSDLSSIRDNADFAEVVRSASQP